MDLTHANKALPQRTYHGLGQHRTPAALHSPRAILKRAEGLAEEVEEFGLLGGRPLPEAVARAVIRSTAGKTACEDCREDAEARADGGRDRRHTCFDERATPPV
jgi:hypothetical protein